MMKKKKLLVTASTFPRWENDTEPRFILDLSKAMTKYFDITVLVPAAPNAKTEEVLEGVRVVRYHYFPVHKWETLCYPGAIVPRIKEKKTRILLVPFLFIALWWNVLKMIKNYDFVLAHWLIPQGIVQACFNKPYIVTGLGGDVGSLNNPIMKKLKLNTLNKAKHVVMVSGELKRQLMSYYDGEDVSVISMGCDTTKFGQRNRVDNLFNQGEKKVVLFVGRLVEKKGAQYFIEAAKNIDAKFVIVGDGPLRESLEKQAEPMKDKIVFLGAKTQEELVQIYASADVLVAPSITAKDGDKEGLPTAIIEAMASGLPIIASDSGGIKEIVRNEENGFLVEEKAVEQIEIAIKKIIGDELLHKYMQSEAIRTAKSYDYSFKAKKYVDLIEKALI